MGGLLGGRGGQRVCCPLLGGLPPPPPPPLLPTPMHSRNLHIPLNVFCPIKGALANSADSQTFSSSNWEVTVRQTYSVPASLGVCNYGYLSLSLLGNTVMRTGQITIISADPDQTPQNAASDQSLHYMHKNFQ